MALTIFLRLFMTEAMLVSPLSLSTDRSLNIEGIVARDYLILANIQYMCPVVSPWLKA
jgi:hypothetical protein